MHAVFSTVGAFFLLVGVAVASFGEAFAVPQLLVALISALALGLGIWVFVLVGHHGKKRSSSDERLPDQPTYVLGVVYLLAGGFLMIPGVHHLLDYALGKSGGLGWLALVQLVFGVLLAGSGTTVLVTAARTGLQAQGQTAVTAAETPGTLSNREDAQPGVSSFAGLAGVIGAVFLLLLVFTWGIPNSWGAWLLGYYPPRFHAIPLATAPGFFGILGVAEILLSRGRLRGLGFAALGVLASVVGWAALILAASL